MDKEKKKFTEAEAKAQMEQARIIFKKPFVAGKFKIRPTVIKDSARIGEYAVKQVDVAEPTPPNLIAAGRTNLKLQCKAVSIALLSDSRLKGLVGHFKMLFFPIHWRMLYGSLDVSDINVLFVGLVEKQGGFFLYQNMALVKELSSLTKKKTKEEVQSLQAEQKSASQPPS